MSQNTSLRSLRLVPVAVLAAGLGMATTACASSGYYGQQQVPDYRQFERRAYDTGYREGMVNGERDARDRRAYRVDRDSAYRRADDGYRGGVDRDDYRRMFRQGYEQGYSEGFGRVAGRYGSRRGSVCSAPLPSSVSDPARWVRLSGRGERLSRRLRAGTERRTRSRPCRSPSVAAVPRRRSRLRQPLWLARPVKARCRAAFQQAYEQGYREARP